MASGRNRTVLFFFALFNLFWKKSSFIPKPVLKWTQIFSCHTFYWLGSSLLHTDCKIQNCRKVPPFVKAGNKRFLFCALRRTIWLLWFPRPHNDKIISTSHLYPPQTVFVVGYTVFTLSVRQSVMFWFFFNILKRQ